MKPKLNDTQQMTRDRLKEVIEVNFNLFKEEPHFFDYITDLVINLMQYEYMGGRHVPTPLPEDFWEKKKNQTGAGLDDLEEHQDNKRLPINDNLEPRSGISLGEKMLKPGRIVTRGIRQGNTCPHCNNSIKADSRICPFCLAMLGKT